MVDPVSYSGSLSLAANWSVIGFRTGGGISDVGSEVDSADYEWQWEDLDGNGELTLEEAAVGYGNFGGGSASVSGGGGIVDIGGNASLSSSSGGGSYSFNGSGSINIPDIEGSGWNNSNGRISLSGASVSFVANPGLFTISGDRDFRYTSNGLGSGGFSTPRSNEYTFNIEEAGVYGFSLEGVLALGISEGVGFAAPGANFSNSESFSFNWSFTPFSTDDDDDDDDDDDNGEIEPPEGQPIISVEDSYIFISPDDSSPIVTKNIVVKLSDSSEQEITVEYFTLDGTATTGDDGEADYATKTGTLTFAPGETEQVIEIEVFRDREIVAEDFEIFARDTGYRTQADGNTSLEPGTDVDVFLGGNQPYGDLGYRVDQEFNKASGFQAYGLTSDEEFYLVLNNPQNATLADPVDDAGQSILNQFEEDYVTNKSVFSPEIFAGVSESLDLTEDERNALRTSPQDNLITGITSVGLENAFGSLTNTEWTLAPITIYDGDKPPTLAVRGTEFGRETVDLFDDFNPEGVGTDQYRSAEEDVNQWLNEISQPEDDIELPPNITGHSLGGALSQLIASGSPVQLDRLITFNSPGISQNQVNNSRTNSVVHYVTRGDIVSLAGDEFLSGNYILSSYLSNPASVLLGDEFKHSVPVTGINSIVDNLDKPADFESGNRLLPSEDLSNFFFNYIGDPAYFGLLLIIARFQPLLAAGLTFRGSTEFLRETLGDGLFTILDSIDFENGFTAEVQAAVEAFQQFPAETLQQLEELIKRELFPVELNDSEILTESSFNSSDNVDVSQALDRSLLLTQTYLSDFATDPEFVSKMNAAFGENWNTEVAEELAQEWIAEDFSDLPEIEIVSTSELQGANGAFSLVDGKILVSNEYIAQNANDLEAISTLLLDEIGHYVDSKINQIDASGDEGEIFAAVVRDIPLSEEQLTTLKAENDIALFGLDRLDSSTPVDTFWEAIPNWSVEAWEASVEWLSPIAWESIVEWSPAAWAATITWTADNWAETTQWTAEIWESTTEFTPEMWENLFDEPITSNIPTNGDDLLIGTENNDDISALSGNDTVNGENGDDFLKGNSGDDIIDGGAGNDTINGGRDNDIIDGGAGNDRIYGVKGNDLLIGGDGNDTLQSGGGNDTLSGGFGHDVLRGGRGEDIFELTANQGTDRVADFEDNTDKFLLISDISFEDLSFHQNSGYVSLNIVSTGETLATVDNVLVDDISIHDFVI